MAESILSDLDNFYISGSCLNRIFFFLIRNRPISRLWVAFDWKDLLTRWERERHFRNERSRSGPTKCQPSVEACCNVNKSPSQLIRNRLMLAFVPPRPAHSFATTRHWKCDVTQLDRLLRLYNWKIYLQTLLAHRSSPHCHLLIGLQCFNVSGTILALFTAARASSS